ncbi:hypothetical protein [Arenibaculum pallidiluteum]|uniref:hypothetical protein n=1 Tax=Arenibaculum pallidiluteum TaxID=2812559 RepID=UPI001A96398C|nr:hypothetical protein [Arenibaculum pallidiluteum]
MALDDDRCRHLGRTLRLAALALLLHGCTGFGPAAVGRDRIDYAQAVARSAQREMLLNIVKLRFGEPPTLSSVSQIVAGYTIEGRVDVGTNLLRPGYWLGDDVSVGVGGTFSDRPTITYNPVRGSDYARMLLTPLPPYELIAMLTSGAPADATLRLAVKSLNGVPIGRKPGDGTPPDPRSIETLELLEMLRARGILGTEFETSGGERHVSLLVNETDGRLDPDARKLIERFRLDPSRRKFRIVFGFHRNRPDEISIYTRSLVEILNAVADEIQVPLDLVHGGQTYATRGPAYPAEVSVRIRSHATRPDDAFVTVDYGGVWYSIDNGDFASKRTFGLLMLLAAVMETAGHSPLPVITIPSG